MFNYCKYVCSLSRVSISLTRVVYLPSVVPALQQLVSFNVFPVWESTNVELLQMETKWPGKKHWKHAIKPILQDSLWVPAHLCARLKANLLYLCWWWTRRYWQVNPPINNVWHWVRGLHTKFMLPCEGPENPVVFVEDSGDHLVSWHLSHSAITTAWCLWLIKGMTVVLPNTYTHWNNIVTVIFCTVDIYDINC